MKTNQRNYLYFLVFIVLLVWGIPLVSAADHRAAWFQLASGAPVGPQVEKVCPRSWYADALLGRWEGTWVTIQQRRMGRWRDSSLERFGGRYVLDVVNVNAADKYFVDIYSEPGGPDMSARGPLVKRTERPIGTYIKDHNRDGTECTVPLPIPLEASVEDPPIRYVRWELFREFNAGGTTGYHMTGRILWGDDFQYLVEITVRPKDDQASKLDHWVLRE
jgi:hypothetical protein